MLQSAGRAQGIALEVRLPPAAVAVTPVPLVTPMLEAETGAPTKGEALAADRQPLEARPVASEAAGPPVETSISAASTANEAPAIDTVVQAAAREAAEAAARAALEAKMAPYRGSGLEPGPVPLGDIDPEYPEAAGKRKGIVRLTLLVNEEGIVDEAIVVYSRPAAMFDEAAVKAFSQARFSPGKFMGIPVKSRLTVEVEFTPINRGGAVTGRGY